MTRRRIFAAAAFVLFAAFCLSAAQLPIAKPAEVGLSAERLDRALHAFQPEAHAELLAAETTEDLLQALCTLEMEM